MAGIGKNRVFDSAALEELKSQVMGLMQTAQDVTETIKEEMNTLKGIADKVPAEAKHAGLSSAASALAGSLDTAIYEDLRSKISKKLDELNAQVPAYDAASAAVLGELTGAAGNLIAMIDGLKGMIGQGSLQMSLTEFTAKLEEYKTEWEQGGMDLEAKMALAMSYLKGLVLFSEFSRDPVNLSTGNFYYEKEDMTVRGRMPLTFKRHYNAMDKDGGILGQGWSHSLEERLTFAGEGETKSPILHLADGQEIAFKADADEPECFHDIHTGGDELHKTEEGYSYRKEALTRLFDTEGHLVKKEDEDGNALLYAYDEEGRLKKVKQSPSGGHFLFTYKEDGTLKAVTDHTGRSVGFFFMEGRLTEVTDPEGSVICYRYEENGRMRAVKNPRGILTVRNEYDEKGRITRQKFPDKGEMCYAYDDKKNTTTLTERNGSVITYVQDERLRNTEIIYHDSKESCTYNDRNQKTSRTDRNGNTTPAIMTIKET